MAGWRFLKGMLEKAFNINSSTRNLGVELRDESNNLVSDLPLSALTRTRVYEQTFEDGTSDLTAVNATQTVQSTTVYAGTYSLQVTIAAGQTGYVETPQRLVSPGQKVTFSFAHLEDANITDVKLVVVWYRANGNVLSTEEFTLTPNTSTWQLEGRTVTAPQNAAYMALRMQATASATADGNVYLDHMTIDLVGQIYRTTGDGKIMVYDEDILTKLTSLATESTLSSFKSEFDPVSNSGSVAAAGNTTGLTVELNKGGRPFVNIYYNVGGAATIYIEVSLDNATWRVLDTIITTAAKESVEQYPWVSYPYVRVRTPTTGIDVEFEIVASR